jgi:alpha-L-rhamnosidase
MAVMNIKVLPKWIWHNEREKRPAAVFSLKFVIDRELLNVSFHASFTGAAKVRLNHSLLVEKEEEASNIDGWMQIDEFPQRLPAGEHEIQIDMSCSKFIPIADVNSYLGDRRVGMIAYLEADNYWLPTDESWMADGEIATIICSLGEEPFGDLENSPDWFVCGGFGDIEAYPLPDISTLSAKYMQAEVADGVAVLTGNSSSNLEMISIRSENLELFYHLRKQTQWKKMREWQNTLDLSHTASVLFDLGKEYNCRFYASNAGRSSVKLLWNGAESLEELNFYEGCITEWMEIQAGQTEWNLPQGFRFIRIFIFEEQGEGFQVNLNFQSVHVDLRQTGMIQTDVPMADAIFDVSAHTSRICHQIGLWDGIKRDRLNWTFDFYLAAKSCYYLWEDHKVIRRAIKELGVGTPYGHWMNGICEYTLWWIKSICEYYFHTGDKSFLMEMREPLKRHIRWVEANIDFEKGGLNVQEGILIEWTPLTKTERLISLQAIYRLTRKDLMRIADELQELELDFEWPTARLNEDEFLADANLLASKVLGILSGYVSKEKAIEFLDHYELQDPFTPLSAYQLAECYSLFGRHDEAYHIIKAVWGGMLEKGATTFWEAFKLDSGSDFHDELTTYTAYESYRMSLCHSWSSTPVQWICQNVLGVEPVDTGFATVRFNPKPVGGIRECHGSVQTPNGIILIDWHLDDNDIIHANIQAPEGVTVLHTLSNGC